MLPPHDASDRRPREAGFTLLEVLAAVAIAGIVLSAIGSLVAVTVAGARSAGDRVVLTQRASTLLDTLPLGAALKAGTTTGTSEGTRWRIDVVPRDASPRPPSSEAGGVTWRPASITITARTPAGRSFRLDTIGLLRSGG